MSVALITGSAGLVGAEAARLFADKGLGVVGIDNDMRRRFFGSGATTRWARDHLERTLSRYRHVDADVRDEEAMSCIPDQLQRRHQCVQKLPARGDCGP